MFNLTVEQLLDRILSKLCFVVIEIIEPQPSKQNSYADVFMGLSFSLQLYKTKRMYNVTLIAM